ncbi:MAG: hypothetical protein WHV64_13205 [Geminicoccaceae bacterium]
MEPGIEALGRALEGANGADPGIDRAVAAAFGGEAEAGWSGSVERCLELLARVLPGWSWHLGWGPSGVLPYARLRHGGERVSAEGPTVPIALLRVIVRASAGARDPPAEPPPRPAWQRPEAAELSP